MLHRLVPSLVPSASALAPSSRLRVVASVFASASSLAPSNLDRRAASCRCVIGPNRLGVGVTERIWVFDRVCCSRSWRIWVLGWARWNSAFVFLLVLSGVAVAASGFWMQICVLELRPRLFSWAISATVTGHPPGQQDCEE